MVLPRALLRAGALAVLADAAPDFRWPRRSTFSVELHAGLAAGDRLDTAVVEALIAMVDADRASLEWATLILYTRVLHGDILGVLSKDPAPPVPPMRPVLARQE